MSKTVDILNAKADEMKNDFVSFFASNKIHWAMKPINNNNNDKKNCSLCFL